MFGLVPFERKGRGVQRRNGDYFDIDSIFENFFNDAVLPSFYRTSSQMKVDIRETKKEFILEAELAGFCKDDVHIDATNDRLTISVKGKEQKEEAENVYVRKERKALSMERSFAISNIATDKISAKMENGILTVTLPKVEQAQPETRKIDIK